MPNLADSIEDQLEECFKVCESFRYFLDNYCWIEDKILKEAIKLKLWDSQVEILPEIFLHRLIIILKAHQLGYTWIFVAAYCLWRAITKPLEHIVINSFNENVGIEIMEKRIEFIMERLPPWMLPAIGKHTAKELEFLHIDEQGNHVSSAIQIIPATEKGAQSKTPTVLIIDESAQNRYVAKSYTASKPGIDSANGQIIIISNSIKDAPGWPFTREIYTDSMKGENTFHRVFLPWWAHPDRNRATFKQEQLAGGYDEDDFSQRYPETEEEAISTLLGSYFGKVLAKHIHTMDGIKGRIAKTPQGDYEFIPDKKGILEVWRYPYFLHEKWDKVQWTVRYVIGSDISEGLGGSYSVAYVYDRHLDEIVARLRSNRVDAYRWATMLFNLSKYYENALICPERTGAGITTCKRLLDLNANVYLKTIPAKVGKSITVEVGWNQTEQGKHDLLGDFKNWLRTTKGAVYCAILLDECSTYIRHENGKLDPEEGKLGDCVIAGGCMIQASYFIGTRPESVPSPVTGWLKKHQAGEL